MEGMKLPIEFKECPNCGSDKRIANEILENEKAKGKTGKDANAYLFMHQSLIADPAKTILSAPLITAFFDACMVCGTVYCVHMDVKTAMPGMGKKMPPAGGMHGHN